MTHYIIIFSPPPPPPPPGAWQLNITGVLHCQHRRDAGAMQYARPCFGAIYGVCSQTLVVIVVMFIVVMLSCLGDLPAAAVGSPVPKHCSWSNPWLVNESRIESIFQSIVQSMVQSRVQSPAFALTPCQRWGVGMQVTW